MRTSAATLSAPIKSSIVQKVADGAARIVEHVRTYFERRAAMSMLQAMSDRDLKDIGLSRSDLYRITSM
jgi:uncharacterized protein YjiS (DUF1127 family)